MFLSQVMPVHVVDETTSPDVYKPGEMYIPNEWPSAPAGTQTEVLEIADPVKAIYRDTPVEEQIYGGWYDTTTNVSWIQQ